MARSSARKTGPCVCALFLAGWLSALGASSAHAQQTFQVMVNLGQNRGLTSYRNDIAYVENTTRLDPDPDANGQSLYQPYLADEAYNWGTLLGVQLNFGALDVELLAQWFARDRVTLNYKGDRLIGRRRLRSDNTVNDEGVEYTPLEEPISKRIVSRTRGELSVVSLMAGYRLSKTYDRVSVFVPVGGGLSLAHISEPNHPYVGGVQLYGGLGTSVSLSKTLSIGVVGRLFALATFEYDRVDDASRHALATGAGTADAFFATMVHTGIQASLIYVVR